MHAQHSARHFRRALLSFSTTVSGLPLIILILDLNLQLGCPKHPKSLLRLLPQRSHDAWYQIAVRLLTKPVEYFEEIDKELLGLSFSAWLDDISERVLLFLDERDGEIIKKPYKTRFTHPGCVKYLLAKYEEAWEIATGGYEEGVFLTITLPPIFPLKIEQYLLSYMRHRLRNWLRRRYKFTPPSIVSNEPQESLNYHNHIVFFGIGWIMEKRDLTEWLDDKVIRFLSDMGRHIQKTINNRLTSEEVKEFNKYGRRLLKRYKRYKRRHRGYRGPVNWITKIYKEGDKWVFVNLPPDLQGNRRAGTLYDGGDVAVSDYLKKYLVKNLKVLKSGFADDDVRLAWYWLLRIPFYTVSPSLRVPRKKSPPVGLKFIGSYHASACEILSLGLLG